MERHDELMVKVEGKAIKGEIDPIQVARESVWFIDDLAKKIENIRQTSFNREDANIRLVDLATKSGITLGTLHRFYDRL